MGPESIADHMYRMALMALIAGDLPGINKERCIKIAIVHDIVEAIVGDITPSDGVPKVEKTRLEQAALQEMCNVLGGGMRAEEIQELWREYEDNTSLEANLVKDFDKLCIDVCTSGKFQTEIGKSWAAEIIARRNSSSFMILEFLMLPSSNTFFERTSRIYDDLFKHYSGVFSVHVSGPPLYCNGFRLRIY
ncbi:hypothetical protein R6Q59_012227 [Mikania micrantha]